VIEERMPPGSAEARHRHVRARPFFSVLAGRLDLEVEGIVHTLDAGVGLEVAPGTAHQALNQSGADVEFLVISQPPSHGDREEA
jgi:mannose-6-phosphate isomerase-like protein (cupin superfamily)